MTAPAPCYDLKEERPKDRLRMAYYVIERLWRQFRYGDMWTTPEVGFAYWNGCQGFFLDDIDHSPVLIYDSKMDAFAEVRAIRILPQPMTWRERFQYWREGRRPAK